MVAPNPNTPRCTVPDCHLAQDKLSKVCKSHKHLDGYCKCRKCIRAAGGNDFHSTARVTLVPEPQWRTV